MIQIINSILILCTWILAAILILFLYLIARFYEFRFGQPSRYRLFLIPLILFLVAALWYVFLARDSSGAPLCDFVGVFWPDLLYLAGGLSLIALAYNLYRTMMGDHQ